MPCKWGFSEFHKYVNLRGNSLLQNPIAATLSSFHDALVRNTHSFEFSSLLCFPENFKECIFTVFNISNKKNPNLLTSCATWALDSSLKHQNVYISSCVMLSVTNKKIQLRIQILGDVNCIGSILNLSFAGLGRKVQLHA